MRCKVPAKNIIAALKIVKDSKATLKIDNDSVICIKIVFDKNNQEIKFIASNIGIWSNSRIKKDDFVKHDNPDEVFSVEEEGSVFLDSSEFIPLIESFPKDDILEMFSGKEKSVNCLKVSTINSNKKKNVTFLSSIKPKFFEEEPPDEKRSHVVVSAEEFKKAVSAVEFAADVDPVRQHLWGVQIEIYGEEDICAFATDTLRLCWYDKKKNKRDSEPNHILSPIKTSLTAAVKNLDLSKSLNLFIGDRYTILKQENQWHGIPNADQSGNESMPEWRIIADTLRSKCNKSIKIPRKPLLDCLKSAMLTSAGRFGIRLIFNSDKENVIFSAENIEDNYTATSYMSQEEPISKDNFSEDLRCSIAFRIEHLREIITKYKNDNIIFYIQGDNQTCIISDKNEDYQYISSVVRSL